MDTEGVAERVTERGVTWWPQNLEDEDVGVDVVETAEVGGNGF